MKNKKSPTAIEFLSEYGLAIFIGLVCVGALTYVGALLLTSTPEERFCKNNPGECVCEEWTMWCRLEEYNLENGCFGKLRGDEPCISYRKKTICELNPNDKENCVCDEIGVDYPKGCKYQKDKFERLNCEKIMDLYYDGYIKWNTTMDRCEIYSDIMKVDCMEYCIKAHEAK